MDNSLISIIIPYFNSEKFIERTICSIQNQKYVNWELILVDDGSTDDGFEFVNTLMEKDKRIKNIKRPVKGYTKGGRGSKNYGFKLCNGKYVVFFDADDYMKDSFLSERANVFFKNVEIDVVFSNFGWKVGDDLIPNSLYTYHKEFNLIFNIVKYTEAFWKSYTDLNLFWTPSNMLWKKSSIENISWDENTTIGEDFEFHSRAILNGLNFYCIDETTWYYMRNDNSMMAKAETPEQIERRSYFMYLVLKNISLGKLNIITDELLIHFLKDQYRFIRRAISCNSLRVIKMKYAILIFKRIIKIIPFLKNKRVKTIEYLAMLKSIPIFLMLIFSRKGFGLIEKFIIGERVPNNLLCSKIRLQ